MFFRLLSRMYTIKILTIFFFFFSCDCSVFESIQTLFWTSFGEVDLETFDLPGMKPYTRFWAVFIFATYSVINVTIMLNLLIAMMSNSYSVIEVLRFQLRLSNLNSSTSNNKCAVQTGPVGCRMEVFQVQAVAELFRGNANTPFALQRLPHD